MSDKKMMVDKLSLLIDIGKSLTSERELDDILTDLLHHAITLSHSDGGSLYQLHDDILTFYYFFNHSLNIDAKVDDIDTINVKPIPLYEGNTKPNMNNLVTCAIHQNKSIRIEDARTTKKFDLSGTAKFDDMLGYHTQSILVVPMKNHRNECIGAIQLVNALDPDTHEVIAFDLDTQKILESLASQAAIIFTLKKMLQEQVNLFDAITILIAKLVDTKSPYTARHGERVPVISELIADAINKDDSGPFKDFSFDDDQIHELKTASWLHDCGKLTVPEHVMDKSTKLENLVDRVEVIRLRAEILRRDLSTKKDAKKHLQQLDKDLEFIAKLNQSGEFIPQENLDNLKTIHERYHWTDANGQTHGLLKEHELDCLSIARGTLTPEEREIINSHVTATQSLLETLPFPDGMKNVAIIAGSHHEHLDGKGYPKGKAHNEILLQTRILTIADVFEALSCPDRPYKNPNTVSEALAIMKRMVDEGKIDADVFNVFVSQRVFDAYGKDFLTPEQLDVDKAA